MKSVLRSALALALAVFCAAGVAYRFFPERFGGFFADCLGLPVVAGVEYSPGGDDPEAEPPDLTQEEEMRGVWIASVYNIDFPKMIGDAEAQKKELIDILDTTAAAGLNTVFFQVRPQGDALYKSEIFPWSSYLTGTAGQDPGYDPLAFLIQEADKRGIRVHAWINPYRLTMGSAASPQNTNASLPAGSPVKNRSDLTMAAGDGRLYLNPGEPEAMELVVRGVKEIIENYNVDGIHFDDYFYPYDPNYDDSAAYAKYGQPKGLSLEDWRRDNTHSLMKMVDETIKETRPGVEFGISPSGVWRNQKNDPLGSATNTFESYSQIYADSRRWVTEGIVDYVVPQIYWAIGTEGSDYAVVASWWRKLCLGTEVKLYIGHAAYKVGEASSEAGWEKPTEIGSQIALNRSLGAIDGSVFYGYSKIKENTLNLQEQLKELFLDLQAARDFQIAHPRDGFTITAENVYVMGAADPRYPVLLDGQPIQRTINGYFNLYLPLQAGKNEFVFTYRNSDLVYTINRKEAATGGGGGASQEPEVIWLDTPKIYTTALEQTVVRKKAASNSERLQPLRKGVQGMVLAECNGYYLMDSGNWTYKPNVEISEGALPDSAVGGARYSWNNDATTVSFDLPYFTSYYVEVTDEKTYLTLHQTQGKELSGFQEGGAAEQEGSGQGGSSAAAAGSVPGPDNSGGSGPLFSAAAYYQDGDHAVYELTNKVLGRLYGYTINYDQETGVLSFTFNNPPGLAQGQKPLEGRTIVLDAGHGGEDNGAQGPAGTEGACEKDLNLAVARRLEQKLKAAGARVVMTRTEDVTLGLEDRANLIRSTKPDLAVSLHRNSAGEASDIRNYKGVLGLYSHQQSAALALALQQALVKGTGYQDDGVRWQSLAVCRIEECPTALLELGFVSNASDYERMLRTSTLEKEAEAIYRGILDYLGNDQS